ncbi:MAG: hypothetical protein EXR07_18640 [Acetobacteraceae bacterium]|nr:hypothetical protein [Acetobacteraceae bacterium]
MSLIGLLKAVHVLSAVIWVGGMFFAYLVLRPSLSVLEPPQRMALHSQIFRRFFLIVWHAMPLIVLSGLAMIFVVYGGMAALRWNVHLMLLLGLVMSGLFLAIFFGPYKAFRAAPGPASLDAIRKLIGINLVLGLVTSAIAVL